MEKHTMKDGRDINRTARRKKATITAVQWVLAIIVLIIIVFPIYWMLVSSVKSQEEILLPVPTLWPKEFHFENYINVLKKGNFARYYFNTAVMTAGILIGKVLTGIFAGYGFSKGRFKGQNFCFIIVLGALMIPLQVTFIPIYIMMANWGMSDTFLGLILPEAVSPYYIFMLRQTFMAIDDSYIEAARIDGASELWVYARIALPLEKPAIVTVALFSFVWSWTDFMGPLIYLTKSTKWTISLGLSQFTNTYGVDWALLMAASAIAILPMIILFFFLQNYFVEGSMSSGVKG